MCSTTSLNRLFSPRRSCCGTCSVVAGVPACAGSAPALPLGRPLCALPAASTTEIRRAAQNWRMPSDGGGWTFAAALSCLPLTCRRDTAFAAHELAADLTEDS